MPYTKSIKKTATDSHQTSPGYVITFVRWSNRDTVNYTERTSKFGNQTITRKPLVVINDATSITVNDSKDQLTPQASIVLKAGDLNYATAVHPGDYVFINMLDDRHKIVDIAKIASAGQPINKYDYGFKGMFKIQTVRRQIAVDPTTGVKAYQFVVHAFGFTEFNSLIYFNPAFSTQFANSSNLSFLLDFKNWAEIATSYNNVNNVQDILRILIKKIITQGLNKSDFTVSASNNSRYKIPPLVGSLMGRPKAKTISDIYNFVFGIWKNKHSANTSISPSIGFNPSIVRYANDNSFFVVSGGDESKLQGWRQNLFADLNQKNIWSILNTYLNGAINESYSVSSRVDVDGNVFPTIIFRQKPFSSNHFNNPYSINSKKGEKPPKSKIPHTKFLSLPRWRISPDLIYSVDLGKDEAARINFVFLTGAAVAVDPSINTALQASNVYFNNEDIERHGLRPAIITSNFDYSRADTTVGKSKDWSYLLFDMLNAGQLRESGGISCVGIEEPIAIGDNLEFDGSVYHIEQIAHNMNITPSGILSFRTNLKVSFGTDLDSTNTKPIYPQMDFTDTLTERKRDWENERILPGFSDTQDLPTAPSSRVLGEEVKETREESFTRAEVKKASRARASTTNFKEDGIRTNKNKDGK